MGFKMFTLSSIIGISFLAALAFGQDSNCEQATAENFDFQVRTLCGSGVHKGRSLPAGQDPEPIGNRIVWFSKC